MGFGVLQNVYMLERIRIPEIIKYNSFAFMGLLFFLFFLATPALSQSNKNIDFKIDNEKLSSALNRLSNQAHLNFTYDAGDSLFNTRVNYAAVDKPPLVILDDLLSDHNFKRIGNQIVIFKIADKQTEIPVVAKESNENIVSVEEAVTISSFQYENPQPIFDTIFISDTVYRILTDTLRVLDTIFIEKEKKSVRSKYKNSDIEYFNPAIARDYGWSGSIFLAPILSNFSLASQENTVSIRNFSLGLEVSKTFNKWNVSGGLKLTHFSENYNHTYNISEGGFFVTDTIDEYYTVTESDTSWYYVTDSTYTPIDYEEYSYNIKNRIGYLEFFAAVSYDYYTTKDFRLYAKVGVQTGIMIYNSGLAIPDADKPSGVDFADLNFNNASFSLLLGTGIKYRINDHLDFNTEIYYFSNFNEVLNDYPISKKIKGLGLKFGLIYYF